MDFSLLQNRDHSSKFPHFGVYYLLVKSFGQYLSIMSETRNREELGVFLSYIGFAHNA
jgi:hypothetical protein